MGRLAGINEYTSACRTNKYKGAKLKAESEMIVLGGINASGMRGLHITKPVKLRYLFFEKDKRRDHDNVSGYAHKVVQDMLVRAGILVDDGWDEIVGYTDDFFIDKVNPRIEVEIEEVDI